MGKRYYTGVPGMHEQFGPVVGSAVKKGMSAAQPGSDMSIGAMVVVMLVGLPVLPLWAGPMLLIELFKSRKLTPGTAEYRQNQTNITFAGVCFFLGILLYSSFSPW